MAPPPGFFVSRRGGPRSGDRRHPLPPSGRGQAPRPYNRADDTGRRRPDTRAAPVLLLPGPQRGGQPRRPGGRGARGPAHPRRHVRDHRRRRRLARRHAGHRRHARRRPPRRRPGGPPPDQPRLRRGPALGLRGRPLRARRIHRRRPPVQGRRYRALDRAAGRDRRRRTSSSATGSSARTRSSGRSTRARTGWPTGSSSASRSPMSTAPASSSAARRSKACASNRAAPSSRPR